MTVSYKRLWKLLITKDMKKKDLAAAAGISTFTISKMVRARITQQMHWEKSAWRFIAPDEPNYFDAC